MFPVIKFKLLDTIVFVSVMAFMFSPLTGLDSFTQTTGGVAIASGFLRAIQFMVEGE